MGLLAVSAQGQGNGDPLPGYPGYPSWGERAVLTLTNACRFSPQEYRDEYVGSYNILLPQNFPGSGPVYWSRR